ncbi:hypothetical protein BH23GEM10_BH23GEM10_09710 [soil metagenome]
MRATLVALLVLALLVVAWLWWDGRPAAAVAEGGDACTIDLQRAAQLRGDHVQFALPASTESFHALATLGEIHLFNTSGAYVRTIGRRGEGPGEFAGIQAILGLSGDRFAVFDGSLARLTVMTSDGEVVQTAPLPLSVTNAAAAQVDDSTFALAGTMIDADRYGSPLATIGIDGTVRQIFGEDEEEKQRPMLGRIMPRYPAWHPQHGIVSMRRYRWAIERWAPDGSLIDTIEREVPWLQWPHPPIDPDNPHFIGQPEEQLLGAQFDQAGRLWYFSRKTPATWREGVANGQVSDLRLWVDTRIEVFDLETESVLCWLTVDLPGINGFMGRGLIATYQENAVGEPQVDVWRLRLSPR